MTVGDAPTPAAAGPGIAEPARPVRSGLALLLPLAAITALLLLALAALLAGARWTLATDSGTRWLLQRLPMVQVRGLQGALLGGQWRADSLRVEWDSGRRWLLMEGLSADGLRWQWRPSPQAWVGLKARQAVARKVTLHTGPPSGEPLVLPEHLAPPLLLQLDAVRVDTLEIQGLQPLRGLTAAGLVLDPRPGASHRVARLTGEGYGVQVDARGSIGNAAPLPLQAQVSVQPLPASATAPGRPAAPGAEPSPAPSAKPASGGPAAGRSTPASTPGSPRPQAIGTISGPGSAPSSTTRDQPGTASTLVPPMPAVARWTAALRVSGTARDIVLSGQLQGASSAGRAAPALAVQARLQPLRAWPLAALDLQTQALDLQALLPDAPATRIAGNAQLSGGADGAPLALAVQLDNTLPGRWNEGRLPLRSLKASASGSLQQPDRVELQQFELLLADATQPAGRWSGQALWQGHALRLQTRLDSVAPQRLDSRAAAMTLSGPVTATLRGLPSPDFRAPSARTGADAGAGAGAPLGNATSTPATQPSTAPPTRPAGTSAAGSGSGSGSGPSSGSVPVPVPAPAPVPLSTSTSNPASPPPTGAATASASRLPNTGLSADWKIALDGRLDAVPQAVQLLLEGRADANRLEVTSARARAGDASAELSLLLARTGTPALAATGLASGDMTVAATAATAGRQSAAGSRRAPADRPAPAPAGTPWALTTTGAVRAFDPLPWWPGDAGTPWRRGPHRLSGDWRLALQMPPDAGRLPALALAQRVVGNGSLRLHDSLLAGVPLTAAVQLAYTPAAAPVPASLHAELNLGGNQITANGRGDPAGSGDSDHLRVDIEADALPALAPLFRLTPALAAWAPSRGSATASATADGRWPALRTAGTLAIRQLLAGASTAARVMGTNPVDTGTGTGGATAPTTAATAATAAPANAAGSRAAPALALARANATWSLDLRGDVALAMQAELAGLSFGNQRADSLRADLDGTLASHRFAVVASAPLALPPAAEQLLGLQSRGSTRAELQASGAWTADPAGGGRWRTRVDRLRVATGAMTGGLDLPVGRAGQGAPGSTPVSTPFSTPVSTPVSTALSTPLSSTGSTPASASFDTVVRPAASVAGSAQSGPATTWAEARDLQAELQFDGNHDLVSLQAGAGMLRLADSLSLRWQPLQLDLRGSQPQLQLRADIDTFAVAPLLARAQPGLGWAGDLTLAAHLEIRATERFDAELLLERRAGDLHMTSGDATQLMGLSEVKLALAVHDGNWSFTPVLRGRSVGDVSGQINLRAAPDQRWPGADAPVDGRLQGRVADIGIWNAWVPPGWRMTGEVNGSVGVGGRFGAPQLTGDISGSRLGLRNLLQGVNVSDGQLNVKLAGGGAQIERFTLRGGDGSLSIAGSATFGSRPQASLQLKAERFRVLGRVDRSVIASGNAQLQLQEDAVRADGKLVIDEGLFDFSRSSAPTLDDDVSVRNAESPAGFAAAQQAPNAQRPRRGIVLGLDVDLGNSLRVRGYGANALLRGQLRLTTPNNRLAVNGTLRTEGGTYAAYGQKLDIERGVLAFNGPLETPRLDLLALRPNIDARVGVAIFGTLPTMRVQLYSVPEMSDTDKLSWLVLGRAPDGLGRNDTALLQRAAVALLAGDGEGPTDTLIRNLGLDNISLRQGDGDVRETVVTVGKQLSNRWYLGYERSVNATTGTWQLIYRIAQRFTLRAQSGAEDALDVIWTWRLQETPGDAPVRKSIVLPRR